MKDVDDIQLITHYPIKYAKETFVILRRLAFLKLMITDAPLSQHDALSDCRDFDEYVESLIKTRHESVSSYAYKHDYFKFREIALNVDCLAQTPDDASIHSVD